jgi:DNA-binding response OmpR family regulator
VHIGILEDEAAQQELYKLWISNTQHTCACYGSAREFLAALENERFDLLLLDWMLPESSGEIVLKSVRENLGWEIPVIFVTSRDSEVDIVTALRAGADDYLIKPPKFLELLARIEALGRRVRRRR